jgi:chitodextrinase
MRPGTSYRFRVRAIDRAGNRGAWALSSAVRPSVYQDGSRLFTWRGAWATAAWPGASGGTVRAAVLQGSTAAIRFSGRGIAWSAVRGPDQGYAQVFVDGRLSSTVNLRSDDVRPSAVVWRAGWGATLWHTVRIRVLGTAGRPTVSIDAVAVLR